MESNGFHCGSLAECTSILSVPSPHAFEKLVGRFWFRRVRPLSSLHLRQLPFRWRSVPSGKLALEIQARTGRTDRYAKSWPRIGEVRASRESLGRFGESKKL